MRMSSPRGRLLTLRSGGWILLAGVLLAVAGVAWNLRPLMTRSREVGRGDGRTASSYGFDLSASLVPVDKIVSSGLLRDGMPALDDPAVIRPGDVVRSFLVGNDKVVGLHLAGEARAYPLRMMVWHEVVNDTVGGTPIAVTYSPLSEGLAVFDRRVGDEILTFGVSGLLYQSNLLLYDKHAQDVRSSSSSNSASANDLRSAAAPPPHKLAATVGLWSQLQGRAITGPHAARGATLTLVPFALCRWQDWLTAHPGTTVMAPIAEEADRYGRDVYATYANSETLRFPVDPLPPPGGLARKARIFAAPGPAGWTITPLRVAPDERKLEVVGPSGTEGALGYYAYWFAWYATHPESPGTVVNRSAASSPERMPSGIPIAPAALPASANPGIAATRRATSPSHAAAPTSY
jgi:hypothetical protein